MFITRFRPYILVSKGKIDGFFRYFSQNALNEQQNSNLVTSETYPQFRCHQTTSNTRGLELFPRARRRFSTSPNLGHGHLTPPRPGEE